ncbi:hypothetical protein DFJ74DRAFT_674048 [Hyaloraphidium curvatum]|nr:hypothetical protein DFJ74DRAFT_674048 [Hyaloraphidium curvatum]
MASDSAPSFSRREWLALFPTWSAVPPDPFAPPDRADAEDRAADLRRDLGPLTPAAVSAAFSALPPLRTLVGLQLGRGTEWLVATTCLRRLLAFLLASACACLVLLDGGDTFSYKNAAVGIVAVSLFELFGVAYWVRLLSRAFDVPAMSTIVLSPGFRSKMLDRASRSVRVYAGAVRWIELASEPPGSPDAGSELVRHDPDDKRCPCELRGCAGGLPMASFRNRALEIGWRVILGAFWSLTTVWTPVVTLAPLVWGRGWSAAIAALTVSVMAASLLEIVRFVTPSASLIQLTGRIRHRAMQTALADFLARCRASLPEAQDEAPKPGAAAEPAEEPYMHLHAAFAAQWSAGIAAGFTPSYLLWRTLLSLLAAVLYVATGSCVPAWTAASLVYHLAVLAAELWAVATANAEIAAVCGLYVAAQRRLRGMLVSLYPLRAGGGTSPDAGLAAHLQAHDAMLESFLRVEAVRVRFVGMVVGYDTIRTLYVTLATVVFGLWSILRGLGVQLTLESACP